jgi:hypothetical protein
MRRQPPAPRPALDRPGRETQPLCHDLLGDERLALRSGWRRLAELLVVRFHVRFRFCALRFPAPGHTMLKAFKTAGDENEKAPVNTGAFTLLNCSIFVQFSVIFGLGNVFLL